MLWARLTPSPLAIVAALSLNAALVAYLDRERLAAIWLAALGVALFLWGMTHKPSKLLLVLLNAIMLSLPVGYYLGGLGSRGDPPLPGDTPPDSKLRGSRGEATIQADTVFPGVVLIPEQEEHTVLVPPLPTINRDHFAVSHEPLAIPFFGSYWIYKWPDRRLPKTAITMRGDPDAKTFRSTDSRRMMMEAHQNLGTFIYTACCRAVQIALRNRDRYPGSISLELNLVNTMMPGRPELTLGKEPITSTPRWTSGKRPAMLETLTFPLPPQPTLNRFDEISVRFHLNGIRMDRSAGVAIERFIMVPR